MTLFRSGLAIALGIVLLARREWADHFLGNFIGGFWIGIGIISIRWGVADNQSRVATIGAGAAAIIAGALVRGRSILAHWIPVDMVMLLLGIVAVTTGLLHVTGQITASRVHDRNSRRTRVILGIFEVGLGVAILLQGRGPWMYDLMGAWALVGGLILLGDALSMARLDRMASQSPTIPDAGRPAGHDGFSSSRQKPRQEEDPKKTR